MPDTTHITTGPCTTQFGPHYRVPTWVLQPGVVDTSWHNDTCPTFSLIGVHHRNTIARLWVEALDPQDREYNDTQRFMITLGDDCDTPWTVSDDESEIRTEWEAMCRKNI